MFDKGESVVSFSGPINPGMKDCPSNLMPSSASWIRGEVISDDGTNLTLANIERNTYVTGVGAAAFNGSGAHWHASQEPDGLSLSSAKFQRDPDHCISNRRRLVL